MIEIISRDDHGIESVVATYKNYEDFFTSRCPSEEDLKVFGYKVGERTKDRGLYYERTRYENNIWWWTPVTRFCYLMYEYDKFITPDNLVGKYRDFRYNLKPRRRCYVWRHQAWQHGRPLRFMQEKRAFYANDDEDAPKIRAKRTPRYLPDDWDRSFYPAEKCWKSQSKRKHQWK